jgi:hypothetical protein
MIAAPSKAPSPGADSDGLGVTGTQAATGNGRVTELV